MTYNGFIVKTKTVQITDDAGDKLVMIYRIVSVGHVENRKKKLLAHGRPVGSMI